MFGAHQGRCCNREYSCHARHNPLPFETDRIHQLNNSMLNKIITKFLSDAKPNQYCACLTCYSACTEVHNFRISVEGSGGWSSVILASAGEGFAFGCRTNKQTNLVQCTKENFEVTVWCSLRYNVLKKSQLKNCRSPYLRGKGGSINWSKEFTQYIFLQSIMYICKPWSYN